MAIHYHVTPITPQSASAKVLTGRHALISFACQKQLDIIVECCQSWIADNGAFTTWTQSGEEVADWRPYYAWVKRIIGIPSLDWCLIPDTITGSEKRNDDLIKDWPFGQHYGVPVWHLHESLDRLERLVHEWPRVAFGSSGDYSLPGTNKWWGRMTEALEVATNEEGVPHCKLHGLRMMNPSLRSIPFSSMDSGNIARNINLDGAWRGTYQPATKEWRAMVLAERMESVPCAIRWRGRGGDTEEAA